jgi:hypothetical protein
VGLSLGGAFFLTLGLLATRIAGVGAWLFRGAKGLWSLEMSVQGVRVTVGEEHYEAGWEAFKPFYETPNLIVIPIRGIGDGLMIPKRCCEGLLDEIRDLLARQTGRQRARA